MIDPNDPRMAAMGGPPPGPEAAMDAQGMSPDMAGDAGMGMNPDAGMDPGMGMDPMGGMGAPPSAAQLIAAMAGEFDMQDQSAMMGIMRRKMALTQAAQVLQQALMADGAQMETADGMDSAYGPMGA